MSNSELHLISRKTIFIQRIHKHFWRVYSNKTKSTFDEHPVEAGEMEEEGDDPAGAVDLVKHREQVPSKFLGEVITVLLLKNFSNLVKTW